MADNQIEFDIVARLDSVDKSLASLEKKAEKTGKDIQENLGNKLEAGISATFAAIAVAATAAAVVIFKSLQQSINSAAQYQVAVNNLNQSMANAGTFSTAASAAVEEFASEIERTTTVSDDAVISLVALSRNFARSNQEAVKLTQAAIELNAATGGRIGLQEAVDGLGKSLSGTAGRLAMQVPLLRSFTAEQLKAGAALDGILSRFGGSAASKVNTYEGALTQLANSYDNLNKATGNIFVKSPALIAVFKELSKQILAFAESTDSLTGKGADPLGVIIQKFLKLSEVLNDSVIASFQTAGRQLIALGSIFTATIDLFNGALASITGGGLPFKDLANNYSEAIKQINNSLIAPGTTEAIAASIEGFKTAVANAGPLSQELANNANKTSEAMKGTRLSLESLFNPIDSSNLKETFKSLQAGTLVISEKTSELTKRSVEQFKAMAAGINSAINNLIVGGLANLGGALTGAAKGFSGFIKFVAGALGDFFIQMGGTIIGADLAISALKKSLLSFFGGYGVAAGIGLVVAGGALKALASGPSGVSSGGSTSSFGTSTGGGFSSPVGDESSAMQETEVKDPGTQVAVNIYGSVLGDKRTLGAAVVDAINESFASDGTVIARGAIG